MEFFAEITLGVHTVSQQKKRRTFSKEVQYFAEITLEVHTVSQQKKKQKKKKKRRTFS